MSSLTINFLLPKLNLQLLLDFARHYQLHFKIAESINSIFPEHFTGHKHQAALTQTYRVQPFFYLKTSLSGKYTYFCCTKIKYLFTNLVPSFILVSACRNVCIGHFIEKANQCQLCSNCKNHCSSRRIIYMTIKKDFK